MSCACFFLTMLSKGAIRNFYSSGIYLIAVSAVCIDHNNLIKFRFYGQNNALLQSSENL